MGVTEVDGKPTAVMLPIDADLVFIAMEDFVPGESQRVLVEWNGQRVRMFWPDLENRSVRIGVAGC